MVLAWIYAAFVMLFTTVVLVPIVAKEKGHRGLDWFMVAFFCSPFIALLALAALPNRAKEVRGKATTPPSWNPLQ